MLIQFQRISRVRDEGFDVTWAEKQVPEDYAQRPWDMFFAESSYLWVFGTVLEINGIWNGSIRCPVRCRIHKSNHLECDVMVGRLEDDNTAWEINMRYVDYNERPEDITFSDLQNIVEFIRNSHRPMFAAQYIEYVIPNKGYGEPYYVL